MPYTAVICCWRVKLFNPAGINHSRHVRNLCTGAAPGCATRNIRARPFGRTVPHVASRRVDGPWSAQRAPAITRTRWKRQREQCVADSSPVIPCDLRNSIFRDRACRFFLFSPFFFYRRTSINSVARCSDLAACINNCNR